MVRVEVRGTWPPVSLHGGHTRAADGSASAVEMVRAAGAAGMEVFGLSEHFYRPREERFRYEVVALGMGQCHVHAIASHQRNDALRNG